MKYRKLVADAITIEGVAELFGKPLFQITCGKISCTPWVMVYAKMGHLLGGQVKTLIS